MGVAVGIFFLGIIGAEIRWGVILPPLAILRWRKTLSRRRLINMGLVTVSFTMTPARAGILCHRHPHVEISYNRRVELASLISHDASFYCLLARNAEPHVRAGVF